MPHYLLHLCVFRLSGLICNSKIPKIPSAFSTQNGLNKTLVNWRKNATAVCPIDVTMPHTYYVNLAVQNKNTMIKLKAFFFSQYTNTFELRVWGVNHHWWFYLLHVHAHMIKTGNNNNIGASVSPTHTASVVWQLFEKRFCSAANIPLKHPLKWLDTTKRHDILVQPSIESNGSLQITTIWNKKCSEIGIDWNINIPIWGGIPDLFGGSFF